MDEEIQKSIESFKLKIYSSKKKNKHSNALIDTRHEYSLLETKMLYCLINQVDPSMDVQKDLFGDTLYSFPISLFGKNYSYAALNKAADRLMTLKVSVGDVKTNSFEKFVLIPYVKLLNGKVTMQIQRQAMPYFVDLAKWHYTSYELDVVLRLTSTYSQRLYEILKRQPKNFWKVSIDEFKFQLNIDNQKSFEGPKGNGRIKEKILEPARKELAEETDISFTYEYIKEGRNIVSIYFKVIKKKMDDDAPVPDAEAFRAMIGEAVNKVDVVKPEVVLPASESKQSGGGVLKKTQTNESIEDLNKKKLHLKHWKVTGTNFDIIMNKVPFQTLLTIVQVDINNKDMKDAHGKVIGNPAGFLVGILKNKKLI